MPVIVVFFEENGLTLTQIMLLQSFYSATIAFTEVPSGYFSDKAGRKLSLLIGTLCGTAGISIYAFASHFYMFLPGSILLGLSQSFISGADTALLYDSLKILRQQHDFLKHEGRMVGFGNFAEAIAFIAGGVIASYSLRATLWMQIPVYFSGFIAAWFIMEPQIESLSFKEFNMKEIIRHTFRQNKALAQAMWFSTIIGFGTLTMAWFIQPYFQWLHIDIVYFGILGAALNLIVALFSFYLNRIYRLFSERFWLLSIFFGIPLLYLILSLSAKKFMLIFVALFYALRGIATPFLRNQINRHTSSDIRTTVMSIRSLMIRVFFAVFAPFLGYITDKYSLAVTLQLSGVTLLIMLISGSYSLLIVSKTKSI